MLSVMRHKAPEMCSISQGPYASVCRCFVFLKTHTRRCISLERTLALYVSMCVCVFINVYVCINMSLSVCVRVCVCVREEQ